jgi:tetratricopeptide (TPR) repeat protein
LDSINLIPQNVPVTDARRLGVLLGKALVRLGLAASGRRESAAEGEAVLRELVQRQPQNPEMHFHLGVALADKGAVEGAIACYRKAIAADPKDAADRLSLADLAQQPYKRQYALAARLYADAFADKKARPELLALHRYNAACASALAAAGKGEGAAKADDEERTRWRQQALDWLRIDLTRWAKAPVKADARTRVAVRQQMRHWQADADLASVRDKAALAKLPEDERTRWQKLWTDVAALRAKAEGK